MAPLTQISCTAHNVHLPTFSAVIKFFEPVFLEAQELLLRFLSYFQFLILVGHAMNHCQAAADRQVDLSL